jgi:S1-C subfamily serine protease
MCKLLLRAPLTALLVLITTSSLLAQSEPPAPLAPLAPEAAPSAPAPAAESVPSNVGNAVVKVFSTLRYPDPYKPWTKQAPSEVTASGVVVEGHRILTNAHAVLYASQVQVQAAQSGDKLGASVVAVAPDIDLALLKLDDESFFRTHAPVARASALPQIKDPVLAYGFPLGGSSLSITKGIVSRIEFVPYSLSVSGLRIQIDAAINPGNSGGPAIVGDKMIGLAFSRLAGESQNIGYIIPNEEIELFLTDMRDGHYDGKPALFDELQTLENPALRKFLKLEPAVSGIVVHQPWRSDASYPLKEWDVITKIGDAPIDDQGMVTVDGDLRVSFRYLVQKVARNGHVALTVVRGGKSLAVQVPVLVERPLLIPDLKGEYPPYFIYGPLVFSKATTLFLAFLNNSSLAAGLGFMRSPLVTARGDPPSADRQELVVLSSPLFPHKLARGYSNPAGSVVSAVNGTRVRSLAHLVQVLRDLRDPFVVIEFDNRGGEALVFPREETLAATEEILTDNGVRAQGSPEMLELWKGARAAERR